MTRDDELELVIRLACLTEDRDNAEQMALLRTAQQLDRRRNANTTGNRRMWGPDAGADTAVRQLPESNLEWEVHVSRVLEDGQRVVTLPKKKTKAAATEGPPGQTL